MAAIDRLTTKSCSTKRAPAADEDHHIGVPTTYLSGMKCMPLDANTPDSLRESVVNVTYRPLFTLVPGSHDIRMGDILVVDGVDYPIRALQRFDWRDTEYRLLAVEDLRPFA